MLRLRVGRSRVSGVAAGIYGVAVLVGAVALGFVMGTILVLPLWVVPRGRRERWTLPPAVWWSGLVLRWLLFVRARVEGAPDLAEGEGAVVLCNHRSWLDPLLLMHHARSNGLSRGLVFWIPILGLYGWLAGAVFFHRGNLHSRANARREVMTLVRSGMRLQVFPEGTRSRDGELLERVYLDLARDSFKEGHPVVCCAVYGTERVLPPGVFGAWPGQEVRLRFGRTLRPRDWPDARAFAEACWDEVRHLVAGLRAEEESPGRDSNPHSREGRGF